MMGYVFLCFFITIVGLILAVIDWLKYKDLSAFIGIAFGTVGIFLWKIATGFIAVAG